MGDKYMGSSRYGTVSSGIMHLVAVWLWVHLRNKEAMGWRGAKAPMPTTPYKLLYRYLQWLQALTLTAQMFVHCNILQAP